MARLSSRAISSRQLDELSARIVESAFLLRKKDSLTLFFQDLLTRTEKAMLGRRILVALLLDKGNTYADIRRILKVGDNLIASVRERLENDGRGFRAAFQALEKEHRYDRLLDRMRKVFEEMPRKNGPRWRWLH